MSGFLCIDVGSTFTKGVRVDPAGRVLGRAEHRTTSRTDVMEGLSAVREALAGPDDAPAELLVTSSAGGGLRIAVVGHEALITAEAGRRVALSAGGVVVSTTHGFLDAAALAALRATSPDLVLLCGGTDGGNADVLRHNGRSLAAAGLGLPVVVAGNREVRDEVQMVLRDARCEVSLTDNVLPRIGVIAPDGARGAIREGFLRHVIGGKHLSKGSEFAALVRAATPDAVLRGVEVLAEVVDADVLALDIGGATTDVYSVLTPTGEDASLAKAAVQPLWHARTVEADLGTRWSAPHVVHAAETEHLPLSPVTAAWAESVRVDPGRLPETADERAAERELARTAAVVALRRHGRPTGPGEEPRPLTDVGLLVLGGGVLRHASPEAIAEVTAAARGDHAGGWRVPRAAGAVVDRGYLLCATGLLADVAPEAARGLARRLAAEAR